MYGAWLCSYHYTYGHFFLLIRVLGLSIWVWSPRARHFFTLIHVWSLWECCTRMGTHRSDDRTCLVSLRMTGHVWSLGAIVFVGVWSFFKIDRTCTVSGAIIFVRVLSFFSWPHTYGHWVRLFLYVQVGTIFLRIEDLCKTEMLSEQEKGHWFIHVWGKPHTCMQPRKWMRLLRTCMKLFPIIIHSTLFIDINWNSSSYSIWHSKLAHDIRKVDCCVQSNVLCLYRLLCHFELKVWW